MRAPSRVPIRRAAASRTVVPLATLCIVLAVAVAAVVVFSVVLGRESRDCKRVVIIGSGAFSGKGAAIDQCDLVVRVNPLDPRPEVDVGRKTDVLHVNDNMSPTRLAALPHLPFRSVRRYWTRNGANTRAQLAALGVPPSARVEVYDTRAHRAAHKEHGQCPLNRNMTSGMLAVLHALRTYPRVYTAGITAYRGASHAQRTSDAAFHQRNLTEFHCTDAEAALLDRLRREGRVVAL